MCSRFILTIPPDVLARLFGIVEASAAWDARFNIAPGQDIVLVRADGAERRGATARWGLVPAWAKDPAIGHKLVNARVETLAEKPSFREAFRRRRCIIPASGFYEWRPGRDAQPYRIAMRDDAPFAFAGLWERWSGPDGPRDTCVIVTTEASRTVSPIYHRMPVILEPDDCGAWLDAGDPDLVRNRTLHASAVAAEKLISHPVGHRINSTKHDDAELAKVVHEIAPRLL